MKTSKDEYRQTIGRFATGVCVIATGWGARLHAMTANAVSSLSLDPLQLLVCLKQSSNCLGAIKREGVFSVNVLREDQVALSVYFSGHWKAEVPPRFQFSSWAGGARLNGCIASIGCEVDQYYEGGDHVIVTGNVTACYQTGGGTPLLYYQGGYQRLGAMITRPDRKR